MYYAVRRGKYPGIYHTWDEAKEQVTGFLGAEYKKFKTKEEAKAFLNNRDLWQEKIDEDLQNGFVAAFTDGSFEKSLNRYSYGVLLLSPDGKEENLYGYGEDEKYIESRNIIGEILGVLKALDWAVTNEYKKIKIYHDYFGVAKWVTGEWKANAIVSKMYVDTYKDKYESKIKVEFVKVPAHSNVRYNEMADALAKYALIGRSKEPRRF